MFIPALLKQNQELLDVSIDLHQKGVILPDTYVLDVDSIVMNAIKLKQEADRLGLCLYFMTKQLGRNPWLTKKIIQATGAAIVAVDFKEAKHLIDHGINVRHVGHLVQPPKSLLHKFIKHGLDIITVYSIDKVLEINEVALKLGICQDIMIKISEPEDVIYPSQEAGFHLEQLPQLVEKLKPLKGIRIKGITHFPCLQWQDKVQRTLPTHNLYTLNKAKEIMQSLGITIEQINAPSASSVNTLNLLPPFGVTHTEPGHALTGTMPSNQNGEQPEKIAITYVSEISHQFAGNSFCYGGGIYRRGNLTKALVAPEKNKIEVVDILPFDNSSIDYHIELKGNHEVSSSVVMCFRTQIFVTRSDVALISGISANEPKFEGLFDSQGVKKE